MTRTRVLAAAAGLAVAAGAAVMLAALVAAPGSWLWGYVSEAGTTGQPFALAYRCGLVLLAVGVALLGRTFLRRPDGPPAPGRRRLARRPGRLVAALLGLAAALAGTSGAVPCSNRCPLPPFQPTTGADVVHTAASVAGMAVLAGAMAAVAIRDPRPPMRRLAAAAAACTVPLAAALGVTMLLVGRGTLGALAERVLLVVAVSWLVGTSVMTSLPLPYAPPQPR